MISRCLVLILSVCCLAAAPIDVSSRVEMFVDQHLIDKKQNVEHHLTEPTKREVVLELDQPWEGPVSAYYTVFRDGEKIRLYYRGGEDFTCYAESTDGVHFTRPALGLIEHKGSKANNVLFHDPQDTSFAAFRDDNPDAKPDEKYKALSYTVIDGHHGGMTAWASPDGIAWRRMSEKSVVPFGSYDSLNCASWDAIEKQYRVFDRYWTSGAFAGFRAIETRTSKDFVQWSAPTPFKYAEGVPIEHFYTGAVTRCPGAEHVWLAFPKRFVPERKRVASHKEVGVSDAMFMSSRDGVNWDRPFLEAWVRPGQDERNWTERNSMPAWGIIETPGDPSTFSMYISEHYRWPTNRLRRLTIRKHGFASMRAGATEGEFVTKSMKYAGERLTLNFATSAAGSVRVELQDESGKPLAESEAIYGDELEQSISWKGGNAIAAHAGKPVRLRFVLRDADVYAFRFAP
ncbi:MAG: hypothetical protein QOF78_3171 [Phycisphaerales bacterium]|jgi:hypothetical protein|nr:hypothetical protein [Phycisphaerales bacterium]